MNENLALYILINKDIDISKGKIVSQVGHSILRYITSSKGKEDKLLNRYLELNDNDRVIIGLSCPQSRLEALEQEGYPVQRDLGLTELKENTLTSVCYGVLDRNEEIPKWIKRLRIYK